MIKTVLYHTLWFLSDNELLTIVDYLALARLNPSDMTALGPALVISIFLASKVVGSKVVLCTDGCANVGVGKLERGSSEASEFYSCLGETASSKGLFPFLLLSTMILVMCVLFRKHLSCHCSSRIVDRLILLVHGKRFLQNKAEDHLWSNSINF